jgi:hypothetical protein
MRPDTLAIMMHLGNVCPGSRVLCFDACFGLAATACVERMGGQGTLLCGHLEAKRYRLETPRLLNQRHWLASSVRHARLSDLLGAHQQNMRHAGGAEECTRTPADTPAGQNASLTSQECPSGSSSEQMRLKLQEPIPEGVKLPDSIMPAADDELAAVAANGFSSVLLAVPRYEPAAILQLVQPLLQPSAALVVFSQSMQPLVECFHALQQMKEFISLQVRCFHLVTLRL